jgi:hypothetical protein
VKKLPQGIEPVSSILRGLEISLRTNKLTYAVDLVYNTNISLSWVQEFINYKTPEKEKDKKIDDPSGLRKHTGGLDVFMDYFANMDEEGRFVSVVSICFNGFRENMDDYLCVLCLRALMNNAVSV